MLKETIHEPGLYFFPGMDMSMEPSESEQQAWTAKCLAGPTGILVYHPQGDQPMSPRQLGTELATDVVAALLAGIGGRVFFVLLLGLFSWVTISVPYWNWYRFPTDFTAAEAIDQIVGWLLAGLALAAIVKPADH